MASYYRPDSLQSALELMDTYAGAIKPYAGGTDLMVHMREKGGQLPGVTAYLDVLCIPELHKVEKDGDKLYIGAATTHTQIAGSALLQKYVGALCEASASVGSTQIRNSGTIGGNVCNGSLAADTLSTLTALSAELELHSVNGVRKVEISKFYQGRGKLDIHPNELLVGIWLPVLEGYHFAYIKLGRRKALAISRMNVAVALRLESDVIQDVRIAPGCVFSLPQRAFDAETLLLGKNPSGELFEQAGEAVSKQMIEQTGVRWSTEYKKPVIQALTARALQAAAE